MIGEFLNFIVGTAIPFVLIFTALVFVHELGHYLIARRNGVRVEIFSIGFGPEFFGYTDGAGTRWKFSQIPLGGYVKMFGDANVVSMPDGSERDMTPEERDIAFLHKSLGKRAAIVFAGPFANFLFAMVLFIGLFGVFGQPYTSTVVGAVLPDSAAATAGFMTGDRIVEIDGKAVERFRQIQQIVEAEPGQSLEIVVMRERRPITLRAVPAVVEQDDRLGNPVRKGRLGIQSGGVEYERYGPLKAMQRGVEETATVTLGTLRAVGEIIQGTRSSRELGGPIRIAQMSGEVARGGIVSTIWFMAVLSVNLGLLNLFPVPMLDGGHLLFYAVEAIRGRPMGRRAQEYGFRIGLTLVLLLMIFVTWNDLMTLPVIDFFKGLFS